MLYVLTIDMIHLPNTIKHAKHKLHISCVCFVFAYHVSTVKEWGINVIGKLVPTCTCTYKRKTSYLSKSDWSELA